MDEGRTGQESSQQEQRVEQELPGPGPSADLSPVFSNSSSLRSLSVVLPPSLRVSGVYHPNIEPIV